MHVLGLIEFVDLSLNFSLYLYLSIHLSLAPSLSLASSLALSLSLSVQHVLMTKVLHKPDGIYSFL